MPLPARARIAPRYNNNLGTTLGTALLYYSKKRGKPEHQLKHGLYSPYSLLSPVQLKKKQRCTRRFDLCNLKGHISAFRPYLPLPNS